jgi:predicted RNase H-like HicB family nuclease
MKKYLIVIEPTQTGFSAYSPDLSGCVSTGRTHEQVEQNMKDATAFHLDGLRLEGCRFRNHTSDWLARREGLR